MIQKRKIPRGLEGREFPRSRKGGRASEEASRRRWDLSWAFSIRQDGTGREEASIPGRGSISLYTLTFIPCFASNFRGGYEPRTVPWTFWESTHLRSRCLALSSVYEIAILCASWAKQDSFFCLFFFFFNQQSRKQHITLGSQEKNPSVTQIT